MDLYNLVVAKAILNGMDRAEQNDRRLRDAAPDMLAALEMAEEVYQLGLLNAPADLIERSVWARQAAIAKARGK